MYRSCGPARQVFIGADKPEKGLAALDGPALETPSGHAAFTVMCRKEFSFQEARRAIGSRHRSRSRGHGKSENSQSESSQAVRPCQRLVAAGAPEGLSGRLTRWVGRGASGDGGCLVPRRAEDGNRADYPLPAERDALLGVGQLAGRALSPLLLSADRPAM